MAQHPWRTNGSQRLAIAAEPLQLSSGLRAAHIYKGAARAHAERAQPAVGVVLHLLRYRDGSSRKTRRGCVEWLRHQILLLQIEKISVGVLRVGIRTQQVCEILGLQIANIQPRDRVTLFTTRGGE